MINFINNNNILERNELCLSFLNFLIILIKHVSIIAISHTVMKVSGLIKCPNLILTLNQCRIHRQKYHFPPHH